MAVHPNSLANLKPIQPGEVRNRTGMTPELRAKIIANAEKTVAMQDMILRARAKVAEKLEAEGRFEEIAAMLSSDVNTLARDTQDRAWGKAQQSLDLSSEDGTMSPKASESEAVLAALNRKHGIDS